MNAGLGGPIGGVSSACLGAGRRFAGPESSREERGPVRPHRPSLVSPARCRPAATV